MALKPCAMGPGDGFSDCHLSFEEVTIIVREVPVSDGVLSIGDARRVRSLVSKALVEHGLLMAKSCRYLRNYLSLTFAALARLAGVSPRSISKLEQEGKPYNPALWRVLASQVAERVRDDLGLVVRVSPADVFPMGSDAWERSLSSRPLRVECLFDEDAPIDELGSIFGVMHETEYLRERLRAPFQREGES